MSEQPAAKPAAAPAPATTASPAAPAPARPAPANKQPILRAFITRIGNGEFDLVGGKDFHQFVVREIYPLLADGTLTVEDVEKITRVFSARADPYNKE